MATHSQPSFEALERRAQKFAHGLVERGACSSCTSQALISAAVELGYATDNVELVRDMLQSWFRATEADAAPDKGDNVTPILTH